MKTLIQKDLRENWKAALIGLLVFGLILLQAVKVSLSSLDNLLSHNWSVQANVLQPVICPQLLVEAAFFCGLFGALLGWLQTRNEAHRDLWGFLIHRPVTRTDIFWGKTIAGLGLYAFAAGLPLLGLIVFVQTPGQIAAPFEWAMTVPLLEIFLAGIAAYFAGLLSGLRQARWYASRGLGIGWVIFVFVSIFACPQFWPSLTNACLGIVALGTAAWGAYQSGGFYRPSPKLGKLAWIAVMTVGVGVVLVAFGGLLATLFGPQMRESNYSYSYYVTSQTGVIYKVTSHGNNNNNEIFNLDGQPLLDPQTRRKMEWKQFQSTIAGGASVYARLKTDASENPLRNTARFFTLWNVTDKTLWYLDRHGKLLGFDWRTRTSVGTLQAHAADGTTVVEPFLISDNIYYSFNAFSDASRKFIPTANAVYRVDFKERTLQPVLTLTNDEVIGYETQQQSYGTEEVQTFLFATRQTVCLLEHSGHLVFQLPYEPGYAKYPNIELRSLNYGKSTTNRYVLEFNPDYQANKNAAWKIPNHFVWIGAVGQGVTKIADLNSLQRETLSPPRWPDKVMNTLVPPMAAVVGLSLKLYRHQKIQYEKPEGLPLAVICAVVCCVLVRRYHFPTSASIGWTAFVFLFGVLGLLAFLCVQEWPAREHCPHCQKLRTVDRANCEHCAAAFPAPEKNGTEIFAPLVQTAS